MTERGPIRAVGPWTVMAERIVFENPWIRVTDHQVLHPTGDPGQYGVVHFKNRAVGVLPVTAEGDVHLVGQHRFPHDKFSWELPEGGGPLAESPTETARRELAEETGLKAGVLIELARFDVSNSVTDEEAVCYLAADLRPGKAAPEPSEMLTVRTQPFGMLLEDVLAGRIRDSLTVIMTLAAEIKALRGELPDPISRAILSSTGRRSKRR